MYKVSIKIFYSKCKIGEGQTDFYKNKEDIYKKIFSCIIDDFSINKIFITITIENPVYFDSSILEKKWKHFFGYIPENFNL